MVEPVRLKIKSIHFSTNYCRTGTDTDVGIAFTLTVIVDVTGEQAPVGSVTV